MVHPTPYSREVWPSPPNELIATRGRVVLTSYRREFAIPLILGCKNLNLGSPHLVLYLGVFDEFCLCRSSQSTFFIPSTLRRDWVSGASPPSIGPLFSGLLP